MRNIVRLRLIAVLIIMFQPMANESFKALDGMGGPAFEKNGHRRHAAVNIEFLE